MTTVQMELWQLITLLLTFFGAVGVAAGLFLRMLNKSLDERFKAVSDGSEKDSLIVKAALEQHMEEEGRALQKMQNLEREFYQFQIGMPNQYVRKKDYIRNQTILEGKIDRVMQMEAKIDRSLMLLEKTNTKGGHNEY